MTRIPPEVGLDPCGRQVLAVMSDGRNFRHYVPCAKGCGFLIGLGDAFDEAWHESCEAALLDGSDGGS